MQSQKSWCHQLCSSGPILPQTFGKALIDNCISSHSILLHMFYALCTLHSFHQRNCLYLLFTFKKVVFFLLYRTFGKSDIIQFYQRIASWAPWARWAWAASIGRCRFQAIFKLYFLAGLQISFGSLFRGLSASINQQV